MSTGEMMDTVGRDGGMRRELYLVREAIEDLKRYRDALREENEELREMLREVDGAGK